MNNTKELTFVWQPVTMEIRKFGRGIMNEQDLVSLLKDHGWTYTLRNRRNKGKQYIYAQQRNGTVIIERYIAPLTRLPMLTHEQIMKKLEKTSPKTETAMNLTSSHKLRFIA